MRMTWVKLLKMSLRNVEKEINSKEDYYTVGEIRNPSKNVIYPKFVPKFSRNLSPIILFHLSNNSFSNFKQNEILIQVIKITQYIQINI